MHVTYLSLQVMAVYTDITWLETNEMGQVRTEIMAA
jgi:hypothetical protein